jgi:hypothetical protein
MERVDAMNDVLEEKLQAVGKMLGEVAESAAEKTSNLVEANGVDLSSVAHGAAVRARRGGEEAASAAKSQFRSGARKARSGAQGLIDQKENLADLGPSAADIRQVKKSIRQFKKSAKRQGRDLARTLDKKTGRRRQKAKAKKTGGRAAVVVVAAVGIGFAIARIIRTKSSGDGQQTYPRSMDLDRALATAAPQPPPTDVSDTIDSESGIRAGSRANGS